MRMESETLGLRYNALQFALQFGKSITTSDLLKDAKLIEKYLEGEDKNVG